MDKQLKIHSLRANDSFRTEYGAAINAPAFQMGLTALYEYARKQRISDIEMRNMPDTVASRLLWKQQGFYEALDWIARLTYPLNQHPDDQLEEEPFAHTLPKHLQKMPTITK